MRAGLKRGRSFGWASATREMKPGGLGPADAIVTGGDQGTVDDPGLLMCGRIKKSWRASLLFFSTRVFCEISPWSIAIRP